MLHRLCDGLAAVIRFLGWIAFAAMIVAVAFQVLARNVLDLPVIWTGDLAQLLFTWLIFIGAALGLRTGAHYFVDVLPTHRPNVAFAVEVISLVAGVCVAWILGVHGWQLAQMRASGEIQSLGISRFWIYLPLPVSGALMAIFLLEMILELVRNPFPEPRA
ncbi:TRAP transporter small permease [Pseudooceanicola sp. CBS1P-1]|uniref:TRAP transporter small permease protein n=1 Tax=Pseudooceanicola albus TaxID=2692189 RepID=A0A6L7G6D5_9RHOB|nr:MULTISPECIES: TRAP transporter small permease [Pseudooceanicola]MBT9385948.1 TRAP transporter small permease [Pseudooceanicola endophyticus]MXN19631.1 TRAP transporter small permease subunit [Pseudooceanicola albus]